MADDRVRGLLGLLDLTAQARRHAGEVIGVRGDPGALHPGEHGDEREFHLVQEPGGAAPLQVAVERGGKLGGGSRLEREVARGFLLTACRPA